MIKHFTFQIVIRIIGILAFCVLLSYCLNSRLWFSAVGASFAIILLVILLIRYVNNTNYSLIKFLDALKTEDHSVYFSPSKKGDSFAKVFDDFNLIIKIFKQNKIEKEAQYNYFKYILEHVNLGIISIRKEDLFNPVSEEEILFLNKAACQILQQPQHTYWHRLVHHSPWLVDSIKRIVDGGKTFVDYQDDHGQKQLSLEVIPFRLLDLTYLIISFQDIKSEIEQKEIEAWHDVIRVLAHEMLNSFTPVSSLASTVKSLTESADGKLIPSADFNDEDIHDINMAATTIKKRSDGLLEFVKDYRTISNVPIPNLQKINVSTFLSNIEILMKSAIDEANIEWTIKSIPANASILGDSKLLEQVCINLVNNSIHALEKTKNPTIEINCIIEMETTLIKFTDNGKGIEDEIKDQIFIPFYTTKKNGSGIGLSLSKNIMKKHGGNIMVNSIPGEQTTFTLRFKN